MQDTEFAQPFSSLPASFTMTSSSARGIMLSLLSAKALKASSLCVTLKRSNPEALRPSMRSLTLIIQLMYNAFFPALASTGWSESGVILGARSALPFLGALVSGAFSPSLLCCSADTSLVPIVGFLSTKYKDLRIWIVGGFALYTIAMIGLAAIPRSAAVGWFWGLLVGFGVGPLRAY